MSNDALIQIPFAGGPDESTDPRLLPPGSLVSSTNAQYDQDGMIGVRYGYTMLANPPSSVFRLAVFAFELLAITMLGACFSYSPGENAFVQRDAAATIGVTHAPLTNSSTGYSSWGMTIASGYRVVGWIDAADTFPRAAVYDQATGALVLSTKLSSIASFNMQVGLVGTTAVITVADNGAQNLRAYVLPTAPLSNWSGGTIISDGLYQSLSGVYTAAFGSSLFAIAYENPNLGNSSLHVRAFDAFLGLQYTHDNSLTAGTNSFLGMGSRMTTGENFWVYFYANTSGYTNKVVAVLMSPATGVASTSFSVGFNTAGPNNAMQLASARLSASTDVLTVSDGLNTWVLQITSAGVVSNSTVEVFHMRSAGAPAPVAALGTTIALWTDPFGSAGASYFLVDLMTGSVGAYPQLLSVLAPSIVSLANAPTSPIGVFPAVPWSVDAAGNLETVAPIDVTSNVRQGLELFTASVTPAYFGSSATLGKEGYLGGLRYDGRTLVENGFAQQPKVSLANNAGAGSTFQYIVTLGWIDAHGNLEESAPTAAQSITSGATPNVAVTINTVGISRKHRTPTDPTQGKIVFIVYRTPALASGDTTFYRLTQEPFAVLNNPAASTVTFNDTTSDASLTDGTHPVAYPVSGELAHNTPETFTHQTQHVQRIWGIGADQRTIWYSQQYVDGAVPAWNNTFQMTVDDAGEPLVGLASLYDKLLIFTRSKIYVLYGQGPAISGVGNDLQAPQRIPSPSGCVDPRSLVNTPMGVMFLSQRGLELIGQDLSVAFIGMPISNTTTVTYPTCTSAVLHEDQSVVRFGFTNSEAYPNNGAGALVNYDLRRNRWSVHLVTCGGNRGSTPAAPMQGAVVHPSIGYVACHNDNDGVHAYIYKEDLTTWTDFGTFFVPLSVTTAWIKSGDLQGWQSVRRVLGLLDYRDAHGLSVTFGYDYGPVVESGHSFSSAQIAALIAMTSVEQVMFTPGPRRRCQAIQVSMTTTAPTNPQTIGTGRGAGFVGLAFEVHRKPGKYPQIAAGARS